MIFFGFARIAIVAIILLGALPIAAAFLAAPYFGIFGSIVVGLTATVIGWRILNFIGENFTF